MKKFLLTAGGLAVLQLINEEVLSSFVLMVVVTVILVRGVKAVMKEMER